MLLKKTYEHPKADITELLVGDVITTSGAQDDPDDGGGGSTSTGGGKWDLPFDT